MFIYLLSRVTFDDIRHGELETPLTIRTDKFPDQLPRNALPELIQRVTIGLLDPTRVQIQNVFKRVELIDSLVE